MLWKKYRMVLVFAVLSLLCMAFIFGQSLKPAAASNDSSGRFLELLRPILEPLGLSHEEQNFLVRKGAHMTEFGALGVCLAGLGAAIAKATGKRLPFFPPFTVLLVGVADEFIQSFLDRTSQVRDVLIDFTGALLGIMLVTLILCIRRHGQRKRKDP